MVVKYTKNFLDKLENLFASSSYHLRYEKGNFKSGYCLLKETKVVIINKYFPLEGKINALIDILAELDFDPKEFKEKANQDFLSELRQTTLKFWTSLFWGQAPLKEYQLSDVLVKSVNPSILETKDFEPPFISRLKGNLL